LAALRVLHLAAAGLRFALRIGLRVDRQGLPVDRHGLRIADGLGQHLAQLSLGLCRLATWGLPFGHEQHVGIPEAKMNPVLRILVWLESLGPKLAQLILRRLLRCRANELPTRFDGYYSEAIGNLFRTAKNLQNLIADRAAILALSASLRPNLDPAEACPTLWADDIALFHDRTRFTGWLYIGAKAS
jgi:hypothetical protein